MGKPAAASPSSSVIASEWYWIAGNLFFPAAIVTVAVLAFPGIFVGAFAVLAGLPWWAFGAAALGGAAAVVTWLHFKAAPFGLPYYLKRKAIAALAAAGIILPVPVLTQAQAQKFLKHIPPGVKLIISDWDHTLEPTYSSDKVFPETLGLIEAYLDSGRHFAVVTNRDFDGTKKNVTLKSVFIAEVPAPKRSHLLVGTKLSGEVRRFDANGEAQVIFHNPPIPESTRQAILESLRKILKDNGIDEVDETGKWEEGKPHVAVSKYDWDTNYQGRCQRAWA
ncbi:MAG: hypothetical protein HY747_07820 [Elusimicrobia bacterium]|nr:hypothetical protein [Elusimicrobiota bacterium]